jgi:putative phosphoserine phosphatase / 1-acylglycerol-3-phosphate O-acyltransferase
MSPAVPVPGSMAEIQASPEGPEVGAFFDLDGTLIAGYSARYLAEDRIRRREIGGSEFLRTFALMVGSGFNQATFEDLLKLGAEAWRGRAQEDLEEMGLRLFEKKIAGRIYPEMSDIVRAHQDRGHTVALTSSATSYQAEPVAGHLGIDQVVCNRFTVEDGLLTGDVERPVLWGPGKADAVQALATERGVDLGRSYFYADGDEDAALMYLVGHPRPTNPAKHLEAVAKKRGWPVLRFTSRGGGGLGSLVRSAATMGSMLPIGGAGLGIGLVRRDKRAAMNFICGTWIDTAFALNGVHLNITGKENAWSHRPAVFIFNHRNNFDSFIAASIVRRDFTGVAKAEMAKDPLVRTMGGLMDVAFIDRADSAGAVAALKPLEDLARKGLSVMVAPEGTRLDTRQVGPFKKGAFRIAMASGLPIVPIVIRNAETIAGHDSNLMHPGTVDITILPPISVKKWKLADLEHHIDEVRELYLATLADWPS